MTGFVHSYCGRSGEEEPHDLYLSEGGYLHSLCMRCERDVSSESRVAMQTGGGRINCPKCGCVTHHIRYQSQGGYIHWFCCSCGRDIAGESKVT